MDRTGGPYIRMQWIEPGTMGFGWGQPVVSAILEYPSMLLVSPCSGFEVQIRCPTWQSEIRQWEPNSGLKTLEYLSVSVTNCFLLPGCGVNHISASKQQKCRTRSAPWVLRSCPPHVRHPSQGCVQRKAPNYIISEYYMRPVYITTSGKLCIIRWFAAGVAQHFRIWGRRWPCTFFSSYRALWN